MSDSKSHSYPASVSQSDKTVLPGLTHKDRFQTQRGASDQMRHRKVRFAEAWGASYVGVIQVIDFCKGKLIGDELPPESSAGRGPGRGDVTHSSCMVTAFFPLSQVLRKLSGRDLDLLISTTSLPRCLSHGFTLCSWMGNVAHHSLAGRDKKIEMWSPQAPGDTESS